MEDEQAAQDPDLRRGQPDAVGVVHERRHPLGEPGELLVEVLDLVGAHAQHRIAVLADLRERELAPRLAARRVVVVVLVARAVLVVVVAVVVIVVALVRGRRSCGRV